MGDILPFPSSSAGLNFQPAFPLGVRYAYHSKRHIPPRESSIDFDDLTNPLGECTMDLAYIPNDQVRVAVCSGMCMLLSVVSSELAPAELEGQQRHRRIFWLPHRVFPVQRAVDYVPKQSSRLEPMTMVGKMGCYTAKEPRVRMPLFER